VASPFNVFVLRIVPLDRFVIQIVEDRRILFALVIGSILITGLRAIFVNAHAVGSMVT
jgi:hypothetical protein